MSLDKKQYVDKFRMAIARISGQYGEPTVSDFSKTVDDLQQISAFMPGAKAKLAVLMALGAGVENNDEQANAMLLEAALGRLPPVVRELGAIMLMSGQDDGMAGALLARAVQGGDWIAGFLILREATRGRYFLNKDQLISVTSVLSDTVPFQAEIKSQIDDLPRYIDVIRETAFDRETCLKALDSVGANQKTKGVKAETDTPEVEPLKNVLTPFECDYLIAVSCALLRPSKVVDAESADSIQAGFRTSDGAVFLPHTLDLPALRIIGKLSAAAGTKPEHGEFLAMLRYRPGQEYKPHHDFLEIDEKDYSMVQKCGQRTATLLTYLNDNYAGGETEFPALDFQYRGQTGSSLFFRNTDRNNEPIADSLHAGLPIIEGEKWMATLWIREKPFWPWINSLA